MGHYGKFMSILVLGPANSTCWSGFCANECLRGHDFSGGMLSSSWWELKNFLESAAPLAWDDSGLSKFIVKSVRVGDAAIKSFVFVMRSV